MSNPTIMCLACDGVTCGERCPPHQRKPDRWQASAAALFAMLRSELDQIDESSSPHRIRRVLANVLDVIEQLDSTQRQVADAVNDHTAAILALSGVKPQ